MAPAAQQDDEFLCDCTPRGRRANEVSNPQWQTELETDTETETGLAAGQLMACCATLSAGPAAAAAAAAVAGDGDGCRKVGPTPAGDGACVNQRNGTLVLARGAELAACWWSVSLARFLELACVLLAAAAVAAAALYPFVSLLVALLACRSVSLTHCLSPCPTVTGFIAIINLLCPPVEARTNHPVTLSHLSPPHPLHTHVALVSRSFY